MGNDQRYNHQTLNDHKTIFLPMFCRLSLRDVKLTTVPIAAAAEPSSPKVSCIGQVKRNNRVTGYPTAAAPCHHHKHVIKPKKLLPPATTLLPNPVGGGGRSGSRSCRTSDLRKAATVKSRCDRDCRKTELNIGVMDPPLPVVKRVAPPGVGRDEVNIWKRRFNGGKKTEIKPIHLPSNSFQLPPATL